ncbi:MAG: hypothetical protein Q9227_001308 [Pyrenula ochraceoflavens]
MPKYDIEKTGTIESLNINTKREIHPIATEVTQVSASSSTTADTAPTPDLLKGRLGRWNAAVEGLSGLEARGIKRVLPEEKHAGGIHRYMQIFALWGGMNLAALNITTGLLGPLVFELGWVDSVCIVIFANGLSACGAAYMATFGPESGNRSLIVGRYFMGYWPAKLAALFNILMQIGFGIISCIVAGQMLSAVNGKGLTIAVGCVICALCIGILFAMLILLGSAGKDFNTHFKSVGNTETIAGNRMSFFSLQFACAIGFSAEGADWFVYYPTTTPKLVTFGLTWLGNWLPYIFCQTIGVGIGTGTLTTPAWTSAYNVSSGALLLACYSGLGGLGRFCVVLLALGSITNMAPSAYSAALDFQILGRYAKAIPRWMWSVVITLIMLVCSVAGRNNLFDILENFIPIMSYWVCPWLTIGLEEHLLFHIVRDVPFDWAAWENRKKLPVGIAAAVAWVIGWAGAIVGMSQNWYVGPVAALVGDYGADMGAWIAIGFAGIAYPPLRYLELKKFGR